MQASQRVLLKLHEAVGLALETPNMLEKGYLHSIAYIVGPPGGGKSMMIKEEAIKRGYGVLCYEPGLERIEKFGGIPDLIKEEVKKPKKADFFTLNKINQVLGTNFISKNRIKLTDEEIKRLDEFYKNLPETSYELRTAWSLPQLIWQIQDMAKIFNIVVVLFDDFHLCTEDLQAIGHELFTHRTLNGYEIPDNVVFILAGNETSACGAKVQLASIRNRCLMLYTESCPEYWLKNFAYKNRLHNAGITFFEQRSNWDIFHEPESISSQFGSPRQWTSLFNYLTHLEDVYKDNVPEHISLSVIQGSVSQAAANRFSLFYHIYSKINANELYDNNIMNVPNNDMDKFAYTSVITDEFYNRFHKGDEIRKNASKVYVTFLEELITKYHRPELALSSVSNIIQRPALKELNLKEGTEVFSYLYDNSFVSVNLMSILKECSGVLK